MLETKKKHKILVVDDSRFNRAVVTNMLEKDYFLEEACDGKEALLILEDHAEEFSLVLTDLVMPNMDGFGLLKAMKERGWLDFLPVIMISSDYTNDNINTAYNLGASELIQRPFNERVCEAHHDDHGPIWPLAVAPWQVHLCAVRADDTEVKAYADKLYEELQDKGVEVIYDDRKVSAGVMFSDADLIGVPFRVIISPRNMKQNIVEIVSRDKRMAVNASVDSAVEEVLKILDGAK